MALDPKNKYHDLILLAGIAMVIWVTYRALFILQQ